jgi:hypothetical protein
MPSSQLFAPIFLPMPFEVMPSSQFAPIYLLVPFDLLSSFQSLHVSLDPLPFYAKSNSQTFYFIEYLRKMKKVLQRKCVI